MNWSPRVRSNGSQNGYTTSNKATSCLIQWHSTHYLIRVWMNTYTVYTWHQMRITLHTCCHNIHYCNQSIPLDIKCFIQNKIKWLFKSPFINKICFHDMKSSGLRIVRLAEISVLIKITSMWNVIAFRCPNFNGGLTKPTILHYWAWVTYYTTIFVNVINTKLCQSMSPKWSSFMAENGCSVVCWINWQTAKFLSTICDWCSDIMVE